MAAGKILAAGSRVNVAVNTDSSCCVAMGDGRLFEALDAEWAVVGASPPARAAFERWAMVEPALAGMASPAEAVRSCRAATPAAAAAVLGALLRHAGEPLAARAVLQAVVPALRTLAARRAGGSRQLTRQTWEAGDDFEADVVEVALRRIAALAGTSPTWPAQAICESTWMTVRAALVRSSRWGTPASLDDDVADVVASPARSGAEALALAVVDAVRAQRLAVDDARVIYATRVLGHTPAELASAQGRDVRALRAQRARAERRLVDVGWAPRTRVSCRLGGAGAPPRAEPLQPEVEPGIDRCAHPWGEVVDHGHAVADQSVGGGIRGQEVIDALGVMQTTALGVGGEAAVAAGETLGIDVVVADGMGGHPGGDVGAQPRWWMAKCIRGDVAAPQHDGFLQRGHVARGRGRRCGQGGVGGGSGGLRLAEPTLGLGQDLGIDGGR